MRFWRLVGVGCASWPRRTCRMRGTRACSLKKTVRTFLCSDLFFHPADPEPLIESGIVDRARESMIGALSSPLAKDMPYTPYTDSTLQRLAALEPQTLALMHGSSYRGDGRAAIL